MNAIDEHAVRRWTLGAQRKCTLFAVHCSTMLAATRSLRSRVGKKIQNECEIDAESTECVHTMTDDEWWVHRSAQQFIIYFILEIVPNRHKEWKSERKKEVRAIKSSLTCAWETRSRFVFATATDRMHRHRVVSLGRDSGLRENATLELAQCELWTCWRRGRAQKHIKYDVKRHHLHVFCMQFNMLLISAKRSETTSFVLSWVNQQNLCVRSGCTLRE